jgi:hypothetical protein
MKYIFTIVSNSHVPQGLTALDSIKQTDHTDDTKYIIFTVDNEPYKIKKYENTDIVHIQDVQLPEYRTLVNNIFSRNLTEYEISRNIKHMDVVRWALKPCLIQYFLSHNNDCIYIDPDLYFINSISIIINSISNLGLSPHFRPYGTTPIFDWMKNQNIIGDSNVFTDGFFNGGFLIVKNKPTSISAINWWKKCCIHKCELNKELGFYHDQKYLDYMYMHFDGIDKINDLGCNIAEWNIYSYNITDIDVENNYFLINKKFTPKFFHFSGSDFKNNPFIKPFYQKYLNSITKYII